MHEETVGSKVVKWLLIGISALFLIVMLLLPLITVISEALRSGWETYLKAVTDRYTIKAIFLTLEATICAVLINTIFGVFAALFWTFPEVNRILQFRLRAMYPPTDSAKVEVSTAFLERWAIIRLKRK